MMEIEPLLASAESEGAFFGGSEKLTLAEVFPWIWTGLICDGT